MGRVTVEALFENLEDVWKVRQGSMPPEHARRVVVTDALVDTGVTLLSLPTHMLLLLGLRRFSTRSILSSICPAEAGLYEAILLTIQGRSCMLDVLEVPDGVPAIIGQIPLEHLDFIVDLRERKLIGNPAHGGEQMYELY